MSVAELGLPRFCSYRFGREAEFIVAVFLKAKGWNLKISKGSRGPADIVAIRDCVKWLIQVKSSNLVPRIKCFEIKQLTELADFLCASAVIATLQPSFTVIFEDKGKSHDSKAGVHRIGDHALTFYLLPGFIRLML